MVHCIPKGKWEKIRSIMKSIPLSQKHSSVNTLGVVNSARHKNAWFTSRQKPWTIASPIEGKYQGGGLARGRHACGGLSIPAFIKATHTNPYCTSQPGKTMSLSKLQCMEQSRLFLSCKTCHASFLYQALVFLCVCGGCFSLGARHVGSAGLAVIRTPSVKYP